MVSAAESTVERIVSHSVILTTLFLLWFILFSWTETRAEGATCDDSPLHLLGFVRWASLVCAILAMFDLPLKYYQDAEREARGFNCTRLLRRLNVSLIIVLAGISCGWAIRIIIGDYACTVPNLFGLTVATAVIPIVFVCIILLGWFTNSSYLGFNQTKQQSPGLRAGATINNRGYETFQQY